MHAGCCRGSLIVYSFYWEALNCLLVFRVLYNVIDPPGMLKTYCRLFNLDWLRIRSTPVVIFILRITRLA